MNSERANRPPDPAASAEPEVPILAEAAEPVPGPRSPAAKPDPPRPTVLVLLFVVLGPLALGVLWKSAGFSKAWKTVLTALTLLQFALVLGLLWYAVRWFLKAV